MAKFQFQKAVRKKAYIKIGVMGISGSGKTYSSILLARGLVGPNGRIAVLDTENNSATLYDSLTDFDHCEITPRINMSFHHEDFIDAIKAAESAGYDCIIIDSFSHLWQAILDEKEELDKNPNRSGGTSNSFANWRQATKLFNLSVQKLLQCKMHVIACMRSKTEYILNPDKSVTKGTGRAGLAPIMRDGIEYEFTTVFDLNEAHECVITKDRTELFARESGFVITEDTGRQIAQWLDSGAIVQESSINRDAIYEQVKILVKDGAISQDVVVNAIKSFGKSQMKDLDDDQFLAVVRSFGIEGLV